jgi:anti-anti-sigma factor
MQIMADTAKGISVACANNRAYVRIAGRGTFQNSQPLYRYSREMTDRGCAEFVVDLTACQGMDSTFLGVLAGIGLRLRQNGRAGMMHLVNISPHNLELLQTLGLDQLFDLRPCVSELAAFDFPDETMFQILPQTDLSHLAHPPDKDQMATLMLEAHDNLAAADQRNQPRFRDLTEFLRERIEQRRADEKGEPPKQP